MAMSMSDADNVGKTCPLSPMASMAIAPLQAVAKGTVDDYQSPLAPRAGNAAEVAPNAL